MKAIDLVFVVVVVQSLGDAGESDVQRYPMVLVPGLLSSQLEAKIVDGFVPPQPLCNTHKDWFRTWVNIDTLIPGVTICTMAHINCTWNFEQGTVTNQAGVLTRGPDYGGTSGIETLDPDLIWPVSDQARVWADFVEHMVSNHGYTRGVDIRGAPYDWRFSPSSEQGRASMDSLRKLIEETSVALGQKVVIASHSLGGLVALYLLRHQSQAWKDKYVQAWVSVATPFGGSVMALRSLVSGYNEGIITLPDNTFVDIERTWETMWWLLPDERLYGDRDLVRSTTKSYTANEFSALFRDLGYEHGDFFLDRVKQIRDDWTPLGVPTHCIYSNNYDTADYLNWDGSSTPTPHFGNSGDGTVNFQSLKVCDHYQPASTLLYDGVEHLGAIRDPRTVQLAAKVAVPGSANIAGREEVVV